MEKLFSVRAASRHPEGGHSPTVRIQSLKSPAGFILDPDVGLRRPPQDDVLSIRGLAMTIILLLSTPAFADDDNKYNYDYSAGNSRCAVYDPYEKLNRKIFIFNGTLDTLILRPVTKIYIRFTNDYVKNRVGTFVSNISEPLSTVNYGLQGKGDGMFKSFWRFAINSTFGIAGLFDVASKVGLSPEQQTLGNTLAYYGVGQGPYIVLPIYGGMGARDVSDPLISNNLLNPLKYAMHNDFKNGVTLGKILDSRAAIMPFTDYVTKNSPDPYIAIRNAILENRESKMVYPAGFRCPVVK